MDMNEILKNLKEIAKPSNINEMLHTMDLEQDVTAIEDYIVENRIMTRSAFRNTVAQIRKDRAFSDKFNFDKPKTYSEYIQAMVAWKNGTVNSSKIFKMNPKLYIDGIEVTEESRKDNDVRFISDAMMSNNNDEMSFLTEIKTIALDMELPFKSKEIDIAFDNWKNKQHFEVMKEVYMKLVFSKASMLKARETDAWRHMARAYFPNNELSEDFIVASIKSFMWQVKRKASNRCVPLPTMLVITGTQQSGKSTFVQHLINHIKEASGKTDFKTISNRKAYNIYNNLILYVEEMAGADKACLETIKDTITSNTIPVNPLYTNKTIEVDQKSSMIGNANQPLATIVLDSSGMRRYNEIIKNAPSIFEETAKVNWTMLWESVDDNLDDPMDEFRSVLKEQQEDNREKSPVEMFFNSDDIQVEFANATERKIGDLYASYRVYEGNNFPNHTYNVNRFSRSVTSLIQAGMLKDWELVKNPKGNRVRFTGTSELTETQKKVVALKTRLAK